GGRGQPPGAGDRAGPAQEHAGHGAGPGTVGRRAGPDPLDRRLGAQHRLPRHPLRPDLLARRDHDRGRVAGVGREQAGKRPLPHEHPVLELLAAGPTGGSLPHGGRRAGSVPPVRAARVPGRTRRDTRQAQGVGPHDPLAGHPRNGQGPAPASGEGPGLGRAPAGRGRVVPQDDPAPGGRAALRGAGGRVPGGDPFARELAPESGCPWCQKSRRAQPDLPTDGGWRMAVLERIGDLFRWIAGAVVPMFVRPVPPVGLAWFVHVVLVAAIAVGLHLLFVYQLIPLLNRVNVTKGPPLLQRYWLVV